MQVVTRLRSPSRDSRSAEPVASADCTRPQEVLEGGRYRPLVPVGGPRSARSGDGHGAREPADPNVLRWREMEFHANRIAAQ